MDYVNLTTKHIVANDESELEAKLQLLKEATNKMPHIINIYPKGSRVIAWVFVESTKVSAVPKPVKKKKVRKKKA